MCECGLDPGSVSDAEALQRRETLVDAEVIESTLNLLQGMGIATDEQAPDEAKLLVAGAAAVSAVQD